MVPVCSVKYAFNTSCSCTVQFTFFSIAALAADVGTTDLKAAKRAVFCRNTERFEIY